MKNTICKKGNIHLIGVPKKYQAIISTSVLNGLDNSARILNYKKNVEVAIKPEGVAVRDSVDPTKNTLYFSCGDWDAFIKDVKDGQFDL